MIESTEAGQKTEEDVVKNYGNLRSHSHAHAWKERGGNVKWEAVCVCVGIEKRAITVRTNARKVSPPNDRNLLLVIQLH